MLEYKEGRKAGQDTPESLTNLQRKMIYLSLMSFQKVHYETLFQTIEREDRMHTFEYERFSFQVSSSFTVSVNLPTKAESL